MSNLVMMESKYYFHHHHNHHHYLILLALYRYFAVAIGKHIQVWKSPGFNREFAPFVLHRKYTGHFDDVISIIWTSDSR
jgi:hypothetical protein